MEDYLNDYDIIRYNPKQGYPGGFNRYYRCILCGDILPSMPEVAMACGCSNLLVDQRGVQVRHSEKQPQLLKKKTFFSKLLRRQSPA